MRSQVVVEYDRECAVMVRATRRAGEAHPRDAIKRLGTQIVGREREELRGPGE